MVSPLCHCICYITEWFYLHISLHLGLGLLFELTLMLGEENKPGCCATISMRVIALKEQYLEATIQPLTLMQIY